MEKEAAAGCLQETDMTEREGKNAELGEKAS